MQYPTAPTTISFETIIQELPSDWSHNILESGAFLRSRKIENPEQLLRLLMLYGACSFSLRSLSSTFALIYDREIAHTSIRERLLNSSAFIQETLHDLLSSYQAPEITSFSDILLVDGTAIKSMGSKKCTYRAHICLSLLHSQVTSLLLDDYKTGETFKNFEIPEGGLVLGDRAYCNHLGIRHVCERNADVLVRWSHHHVRTQVVERKGGVLSNLKKHRNHRPFSIPVELSGKSKEPPVKGYLHACRLPRHKAAEQKAAYLKQCKHENRDPNPTTLYLTQWIVAFTTADLEKLSSDEAIELYRCRWQVELAIKRFKSLTDARKMSCKHGSPMAQIWMSSKFLFALLVERKAISRLNLSYRGEECVRNGLWIVMQLIVLEYRCAIAGCSEWSEVRWMKASDISREKPRKRKRQCIPRTLKPLIENSNTR